jgi:hypothetical protein
MCTVACPECFFSSVMSGLVWLKRIVSRENGTVSPCRRNCSIEESFTLFPDQSIHYPPPPSPFILSLDNLYYIYIVPYILSLQYLCEVRKFVEPVCNICTASILVAEPEPGRCGGPEGAGSFAIDPSRNH